MAGIIRFNNDLMSWARWGKGSLDLKVRAAAEAVMSFCVLHAWDKMVHVPDRLEPFVDLLEHAWSDRNVGKAAQ